MSQQSWIGYTLGGRYKIEELLGHGGMSSVYKAYDPNVKRPVAVKIIHPHLTNRPGFVDRFEREAAAVGRLRHDNIIQVYDSNHDEGVYYIVFEYIDGETLQDRLKKFNTAGLRIPVAEAVNIAAALGDAVGYAHEQGMIHRDIKPANIMLTKKDKPVLMDFGIVKMLGGANYTATDVTLGTMQYMSPEQIKGTPPVGPYTDIYAMGITLFEMLGGRTPFEADSTMAIMMMHVEAEVPDLRNLRQEVPADLVAIINKAMAKDPADRFGTAFEFAEALRSARLDSSAAEPTLQGMSAVHTVVEPLESIPAPEPGTPSSNVTIVEPIGVDSQPHPPVVLPGHSPYVPQKRKARWLIPVALLLILALIAGGVWFVFFRGPSVDDLLLQAEEQISAGQYDEAIATYETILLEHDPQNAAAKTGYTKALIQQAQNEFFPSSQYKEAIDNYQKILAEFDQNNSQAKSGLAQTYVQMGNAHLDENQFDEATESYRQALEILPQNIDAHRGLGQSYLNQEIWESAISEYEVIIQQYPDNGEDRLELGKAYYQMEDFEQAKEQFLKINDVDVDGAEVHLWLGRTYYNLDDFDQAVTALEQSLELNADGTISETLYLLGVSYAKTGAYETAEDTLKQLVALPLDDEMSANAWTQLGWMHFHQDEFDEAVDAFATAQSYDLVPSGAFQGQARAYMRQGDYKKAIEPLQTLVHLEPNQVAGFNLLGKAYLGTHVYDKAQETYEQALSIDSESFDAQKGLARSLSAQGKFEAAVPWLNKWLEAETIQSEQVDAQLRLGEAYYETGDFNNALNNYQQALSLNPNSVEAQGGVAKSLYNEGSYDAAVPALEQWLTKDVEISDRALGYLYLGWISFKQGNYETAGDFFEQSLMADGENPDSHYGLAWSYAKLGENDEALTHYQARVKYDPDNGDAYRTLGWGYFNVNDFEQSLLSFQQAIEIDPDLANAYYGAGRANKKLERCTEATKSYFRKAVELNGSEVLFQDALESCGG